MGLYWFRWGHFLQTPHTSAQPARISPFPLGVSLLCTTFRIPLSWRKKGRFVEPTNTQANAEASFRCETGGLWDVVRLGTVTFLFLLCLLSYVWV